MRKAFTLVELLVVIAILAILMSVLIVSFKRAPMQAEMAKCRELLKETQTALTSIFDEKGVWPRVLIQNNNTARGLDATAAYPLRSKMDLSYDSGTKKLTQLNRFGIVTPWAEAVIKLSGDSASESDEVSSVGGTIADHRLRYALSLDGQGSIKGVNPAATLSDVKADTVDIRAIVAVWCRGPRYEFISSWVDGDTEGVK